MDCGRAMNSNEKLFAERERVLTELARNNAYRHPPKKRTWWDWEEIRAQVDDLPVDDVAAKRMLKALRLATSIEVLEQLLADGGDVPLDRLDPEWVKRYGLR